ncbi:MAG: zeta toxin family protein, partial [Endozoicomonas sp.]
EQMKADTSHQVVAYKGGFGAGKTSHIEATYQTAESQGTVTDRIISSDNAKKSLRRPSSLSHHVVHKQASNMAFNLLDGMIKGRLSGTIIFDSALSYANDVSTLMKKAEAAGRTLKVVDITRNDTARALAVLARSVAGEAPRMPAKTFLNSAEKDRQGRPDCMNKVLESQPAGDPPHTYELYCCNELGSDRQRIVTLKSGHQLTWNPALTAAEINQRMANEGIRFNSVSGTFGPIHSYQPWSERMTERLMKPVGTLLELLTDDVKQPLREQFIQRTIHTHPQKDYPKTAKELYQALSPEIQKALPPTAFKQAFDLLNKDGQQRLEEAFWKSIHTQKPLTYLDLPALFALEINQQLLATPPTWKA